MAPEKSSIKKTPGSLKRKAAEGPSKSTPEKQASGVKKAKKSLPISKPKIPTPEPSDSESLLQDHEGSNGEEEEVHLQGFSTDDDDSSDEDEMDQEPSAFDVEKLPTIAKDDATVKRKLDKAKRTPVRGVFPHS